jgi:hypothetical protein
MSCNAMQCNATDNVTAFEKCGTDDAPETGTPVTLTAQHACEILISDGLWLNRCCGIVKAY